MKKLLVCTVVAVALAVAWHTAPASAHHPEVVAVNVCTDGVPSIEVTAYAWLELPPGWTPDHRVNNDVRIDVDGPGVDLTASGAFTAPDYGFTVQFAVPQAVGQTLTVRATSVAPWGPSGEYGSAGEYVETTVFVEPSCDDDTTTTTTTTTSVPTTTAPTTTVGPGSEGTTSAPPAPTTAAPGTDTDTEVGGAVQVNPQVPGGDAAAQIAFTGASSDSLVLAGLGLVAAGAGLVLGARRRRTA